MNLFKKRLRRLEERLFFERAGEVEICFIPAYEDNKPPECNRPIEECPDFQKQKIAQASKYNYLPKIYHPFNWESCGYPCRKNNKTY